MSESPPNLNRMDIDLGEQEAFIFHPPNSNNLTATTASSNSLIGSFPPQNFNPPPMLPQFNYIQQNIPNPYPQLFNPVPQMNPRGMMNPYSPSVRLDNDEPVELKPFAKMSESAEDLVSITMKSAYSKIQANKPIEMPCILSVHGGNADIEQIEKNRQGLDLVFVVDISGSMSGEKLELVKTTMEFVVTIMKEFDRVCIIPFSDNAYILCPLTVMNESGKANVTGIIQGLSTIGGTNMESGIAAAFHCLADRKITNQNTSIFMLSDGVDNDTRTVNARMQETTNRYIPRISGEFRLHTFGYGRDHDSRVMSSLAENNNGNFYYVENQESVTDAFGNCLGELVALIANNVIANITTVTCEVPFKLSKVYSINGDTSFPMQNIYFDDRKDAVFLLQFFGTEDKIQAKTISPIEAVVTYTLKSGRQTSKKGVLVIEITEEAEIIEVPEVMIEYYRVRGAEMLKEVMVLADRNDLQAAEKKAKEAEEEIKNSSVSQNPKIQALIKDLADAQVRVASKNSWESGGRAQLSSVQNCHYHQKASNNCVSYQMPMQNMYSLSANTYVSSKPMAINSVPLLNPTVPQQMSFNSVPVRNLQSLPSPNMMNPYGQPNFSPSFPRNPGQMYPQNIPNQFGSNLIIPPSIPQKINVVPQDIPKPDS